MRISSLVKRIEIIERRTGKNIPEVKIITVCHDDYLEKDIEIE